MSGDKRHEENDNQQREGGAGTPKYLFVYNNFLVGHLSSIQHLF